MNAAKIREILYAESDALFEAAEKIEDDGKAETRNRIRQLIDAAEGLICIHDMPDHSVIRFAQLFRGA